MSACAAPSTAASSDGSWFFPSVILHRKSRHRLDRLLFEHKSLALVPAPRLVVLAHAAQPDFIRQVFSRETEQLPAETLALIVRRNKELVEIAVGQMQCQHRGD